MKKIYSLLLVPLFIFSCGPKREVAFKKLKLNDRLITLVNPIYRQSDKYLYCDLNEVTGYLGGSTEFSQNYLLGVVTINGELITFSSKVKVATISKPKNGEIINYNLSCSVNTKSKGLDVPIDDYANILNYSHSTDGDVYVLTSNATLNN